MFLQTATTKGPTKMTKASHNYRDNCPKCEARCRYAPENPCDAHPAFAADNCPACGTAARI